MLSPHLISTKPTLIRLPQESSRRGFALLALLMQLKHSAHRSGPQCHQLLQEWLDLDLDPGRELQDWLGDKLHISITRSRLLASRGTCQTWLERGGWMAKVTGTLPYRERSPHCPGVLFGRGSFPMDIPLAAFFNSRKPRALSPHAPWLEALRILIHEVAAHRWGIVSSLGTLTYDLATHAAQSLWIPTLIVTPEGFDADPSLNLPDTWASEQEKVAMASCRTSGMICPKAERMLCRDSLLAAIAQVPIALEIRKNGNLINILTQQAALTKKQLWVLSSENTNREEEGNEELLRNLKNLTQRIALSDQGKQKLHFHLEEHEGNEENEGKQEESEPILANPISCASLFSQEDARSHAVVWESYLYHYTRSHPGPWPGQSYGEYLQEIYQGMPGAGHTSQDALARILTERRLRASSKMVRGVTPVVSWTAHPPMALKGIRHWSKALMRWTFELYGIAVCKKRLKAVGVRPSIYGPEKAFLRLKESDRYRFQKHEPPHCCWRHEREHRLPGDLHLDQLHAEEYFVFVPHEKEAERLRRLSAYDGQILVLGTHWKS